MQELNKFFYFIFYYYNTFIAIMNKISFVE